MWFVSNISFFSVKTSLRKKWRPRGRKKDQKKLNKERKQNGKEKQTLFSLSKGLSDPNVKWWGFLKIKEIGFGIFFISKLNNIGMVSNEV